MSRARWIIVLAALAVGGCGGGSPEMTQFSQGGLRLDYPSGWHRDGAEEGSDGLVLFAVGDSDVKGVPYRLTLFDQPREDASVALYGKTTADTRPSDTHGRLVEDGEADVAGSDGAWRVVTDYRVNPEGGGDPADARVLDILPIKGHRQYRLTISGPREGMQSDEIERIVTSLRIGGGSAA